MKTGRFSVGETLLTIGFVWEGNNKGSLYRRPYQAGLFGIDVEAVVKIEVMELTVVEHHKVPSEFDEGDYIRARAQGTVIVTDNTRRYTDMPGVVHTPKFFAALRNVKKR